MACNEYSCPVGLGLFRGGAWRPRTASTVLGNKARGKCAVCPATDMVHLFGGGVQFWTSQIKAGTVCAAGNYGIVSSGHMLPTWPQRSPYAGAPFFDWPFRLRSNRIAR